MVFSSQKLKKREFKETVKKGIVLSGRFFILKISKINLNGNKFGFVVSKKISKKAVERNRMKRILREAARSNSDSIGVGGNIIFFAKKELFKKTFKEVDMEIKRLFKKAKLTKD